MTTANFLASYYFSFFRVRTRERLAVVSTL